jgi:cobalt-zinc-cadmium efflux system protein
MDHKLVEHDHEHNHEHDHKHNHEAGGHHHAPANFGWAFAIGIILNTGFVIIEAIYGIVGHSLALLADAGHNLSDVLGLAIAWIAIILVKRLPNKKRTYGLRGTTILAALFNAVFLLVSSGAIGWEAIQRFRNPSPVEGHTVIWVAAVGIAINLATAFLFMSGRKGDLNIRGAFLHMVSDAAVAFGVVIAGFAILWTGWLWLDPAISMLILVVILIGTWGLLKESTNLALAGVPQGFDVEKIENYLKSLPKVAEVHDLHIWGMSTTETALTVHIVVRESKDQDDLLNTIDKELKGKFKIDHPTIQIENGTYSCRLAPDEIV